MSESQVESRLRQALAEVAELPFGSLDAPSHDGTRPRPSHRSTRRAVLLVAIAAVSIALIAVPLSRSGISPKRATSPPVSTTTKAISAVGVQVFVKLDATTVQVAVLRSSLKLTPAITSCVYLDHQQSYEYAVKLFKADGQSSAISALTPARSPTVFVCQLKEPGDAAAMKNLFAKRPGVFRVVTGVWQST